MEATFNQGDLFSIKLVSIDKPVKDFCGDRVTLHVCNLAVEQTVFKAMVQEVFAEGEIEEKDGYIEVVLQLNAENLWDGKSDLSDTAIFLESLAGEILVKLQTTQNWGSDSSSNRRAEYDLLD